MTARFALGLALLLAACGGAARPDALRQYKALRFSEGGESVARRLPKLTGEADALYAEAEAAQDAARPDEAAHKARLARYRFLVAQAYAERKVQQIRLAELSNKQRLMDERLADARRRERAALEAVARAQAVRGLEARLAAVSSHPQAGRLREALETLRQAYAKDAARLAPADELQVVEALTGALDALERPAEARATAQEAVERAVLQSGRLLADVTPRYEEEQRRAAVEARLRRLLDQAARIPELEARLEGRGLVLTLRQLFADRSQEVMPHRRPLVEQVGALLLREPGLSVRVEGHTERREDADAAIAVSGGRAASVRAVLVAQGLPESAVESAGRGGAEPIADDRTRDGKTRNRRIEIVVLRNAPRPAGPAGLNPGGAPAP